MSPPEVLIQVVSVALLGDVQLVALAVVDVDVDIDEANFSLSFFFFQTDFSSFLLFWSRAEQMTKQS